MIELEIQGLSEKRDGLLIDVGRLAVANGFTLQRQRLAQDPHGVLMTMVVRGPERKQRALEAALNTYERLISFQLAPFVEGDEKPHFAASRKPSGYTPAPLPPPSPPPEPVAAVTVTSAVAKPAPMSSPSTPLVIERAVAVESVPEPQAPTVQQDDVEFLRRVSPARAPAPAPVVAEVAPFVEVIQLDADEGAIEKLLRDVEVDYPQIIPHVLKLDRTVAEGARESSLELAGQRAGAWVFQRDHLAESGLSLLQALERIGVPALGKLVDVEQQGEQLHIRLSPLCAEEGHSGCKFFSGYLEGLLAPAMRSQKLSIFAVGCRSWGAGECVLAISE